LFEFAIGPTVGAIDQHASIPLAGEPDGHRASRDPEVDLDVARHGRDCGEAILCIVRKRRVEVLNSLEGKVDVDAMAYGGLERLHEFGRFVGIAGAGLRLPEGIQGDSTLYGLD